MCGGRGCHHRQGGWGLGSIVVVVVAVDDMAVLVIFNVMCSGYRCHCCHGVTWQSLSSLLSSMWCGVAIVVVDGCSGVDIDVV